MRMKMPVIKSCTNVCAPNPTARPITPAPASSGVTLTPRLAKPAITAMIRMVTKITLRIIGVMVCARAWLTRRPRDRAEEVSAR